MFPFVELGRLRLPTYGLLLGVAILLGVCLAVTRAKRHELAPHSTYTMASLAVLVALLGAKLTHWLIHRRALPPSALVSNAGTFLGGFLLAFLATVLCARRAKVSLWRLGDSFAPSLALGVAIVRVGCLAASCDYGKPTHMPWGVVFTNPLAAQLSGVPLGARLHPSQLYESGLGLLILSVLLTLERRQPPPGFLILAFASLYSVGRFLLEFLRGDVDRGFWGPLSTSQWLALVTLLVFLILYRHPMRRPEASADFRSGSS